MHVPSLESGAVADAGPRGTKTEAFGLRVKTGAFGFKRLWMLTKRRFGHS